MTIFVPLAPLVNSTKYDEIAIYNKALTVSQIAAHYAAASVNYLADPQDSVGWEEVYGSDYPLTQTDVPVLTNGLCRVRWQSTFFAFAIDAYSPGVGWLEQGRITIFHDDSTGSVYSQQGLLQSTEVVEWTPERAVVQIVTSVVISGTMYRMETYVSLQRGWTGPRFECYPNPKTGNVKLGSRIVFTPYQTTMNYFAGGAQASPVEPWVSFVGGNRAITLTWLRSEAVTSISDTSGYGATRTVAAVSAPQGGALQGYVSVRVGLSAGGIYQELENNATFSGTASLQADGAASGGQTVRDTQTANTAASTTISNTVIGRLPIGRYQVWAKARIGTAGDTMSLLATFVGSGSTATPTVTTTSTTYVWVYLGEAVHTNLTDTMTLSFWRSAGTGVAGEFVDQIALVPTERRLIADPAYDGARDMMAANLIDARYVPELVAR